MTKLTLEDIADLRAYEREREDFRARIIELKTRRRVHVGPILTFVFENRDTIRFQIQEMARAEKIISDEGIEAELRAYNPLIPEAGSAVHDDVHRAHLRGSAAGLAPEARRHRTHRRAAGGPRRRAHPLRRRPGPRQAAHTRGDHRLGALRELRPHAGPGRGVRRRSGGARPHPPGVRGRTWSSPKPLAGSCWPISRGVDGPPAHRPGSSAGDLVLCAPCGGGDTRRSRPNTPRTGGAELSR